MENKVFSWSVQKVGAESAAEIHQFWSACPKVWSSANSEPKIERVEDLSKVIGFLKNPKVNYWIIRKNHQIIAGFGSYDWQHLPYYTLVKFKSLRSGSPIVFKAVFADLLDAIIQYQEKQNKYTFYFVASLKQFYNRNQKAQNGDSIMRDIIPAIKNYIFTTEVVIRKNEASEWRVYNEMIANQATFVDVVIRRASKNLEINYDNFK